MEIGHKRSNVLSGSQPVVRVISDVDEAAGRDRQISHFVSVEWEFELKTSSLKMKSLSHFRLR